VAALISSPAAAILDMRSFAFRRYHFQFHLLQWHLVVMAELDNGVRIRYRMCPKQPGAAAATAAAAVNV
jgi:hypothetical protein